MEKPLDAAPSVVTESQGGVAEGTESYPTYDSAAGQTAMIPMPPQIIPVGDGNKSVGSGRVGGSGEDPFEGFYAHPGGLT